MKTSRTRIGLVSSLFSLLAACSSSPVTESGSSEAADGGTFPTMDGDGGESKDASSPLVTGPNDAGQQKDGSTTPPPPPGCDLSKDPKDSAPCVVNGYGVFVDANAGSDANDGTKAHPMQTIQAALAKNLPRVYACAGTYAEHVKITAGVGIYGGFSCADWSYATANVVSIAPVDAGYAVEIAAVSDAVLLEDVTVTAQAGTAALPNSIAIFAHDANLTMKRSSAIAADGYIGTSSTVGSNYSLAQAPNGKPGSGVQMAPAGFKSFAGLPPACACANGVNSTAGRGYGYPSPEAASAGLPAIAGMSGGALGSGACGAGGNGQTGANGANGKDAPTPTAVGSFTAQGVGRRRRHDRWSRPRWWWWCGR